MFTFAAITSPRLPVLILALSGIVAACGGTSEEVASARSQGVAGTNTTATTLISSSVSTAPPAAGAAAQIAATDATALRARHDGDLTSGYRAGQVKWHPGHYVSLLPGQAPNPSHMQAVITELQGYSMLRGVQIRYTWAELEPSSGQYDFSRIQRDLDLLQPAGKRLFILLQTKQFGDGFPTIPTYLDTDISGGGSFAITNAAEASSGEGAATGRNIKLWNRTIRDRLIALNNALGARFNQHPSLEGLAMTETAMGTPVDIAVTARQKQSFYDNLLQVQGALRKAFPNTVTMQFTNYPKNILPTFVAGLRKIGAALGGPDIYLDDPDLLTGVYPYYGQQSGQLPLGPSVQGDNYYRRVYGGPEEPPSIDELYQFGRNELRANYMFWTRRAYPNDNPYAQVLSYMSSPGFPAGLAGGLDVNCPRAYAQCVE